MTTKSPAKKLSKTRHYPMEHPRHRYAEETAMLQIIALSCNLTEAIKWGKPCYTLSGKNIVLIQGFNNYVALMFFKGALLKDTDKLLCRIGEHMQAPRQLRFTNAAEIKRLKPTIKAYIEEAIEVEKSGAKVPLKKTSDYAIPEELQNKLNTNPALKKAFNVLTPGRQKAYIFQISAAKQSTTREARVEKFTPQILAGKGLND